MEARTLVRLILWQSWARAVRIRSAICGLLPCWDARNGASQPASPRIVLLGHSTEAWRDPTGTVCSWDVAIPPFLAASVLWPGRMILGEAYTPFSVPRERCSCSVRFHMFAIFRTRKPIGHRQLGEFARERRFKKGIQHHRQVCSGLGHI